MNNADIYLALIEMALTALAKETLSLSDAQRDRVDALTAEAVQYRDRARALAQGAQPEA